MTGGLTAHPSQMINYFSRRLLSTEPRLNFLVDSLAIVVIAISICFTLVWHGFGLNGVALVDV
jgi:hypothetical protein